MVQAYGVPRGFFRVQPSHGSMIQATESEFDVVIVCTGQNSVPNMPDYPGLSQFEGSKIHSKSYRIPEVYNDQTVLTVGGAISCWDITQDVAKWAKHIYVSHKTEHRYTAYPQNVELTIGISKFTSNGAILTDGRELTFDSVIFNTGYQRNFPFLSSDCGVQFKDKSVRPLYKHTISVTNPTLSFVSITGWLFYFPLVPLQASFILAVLEERFQLPPVVEMKKYEEGELKTRLDRGWPERYLHRFEELQYAFYDDLAQSAGIDMLPRWFKPFGEHIWEKLLTLPMQEYKSWNYIAREPGSFEIVSSPENGALDKNG